MSDGEQVQGDVAALAERLLWHPHPWGQTSVTLYLKRLPDETEALVPIPSNARLLGSALHRREGRPAMAELVFDSDEDPATFLATYEAELITGGWVRFEEPRPMQGFVSGDAGARRAFSIGADGPLLSASVTSQDHAPSDVRLRLDWDSRARMHAGNRHQLPPGGDLMPALRAPAGVSLQAMSGSGSDERWTTESTVDTERSAAALEAHFAGQLQTAGWTRLNGGDDDTIAWSAWHLPNDAPWRGFLLVTAAFGGTERFLSLRLDATHRDGRRG